MSEDGIGNFIPPDRARFILHFLGFIAYSQTPAGSLPPWLYDAYIILSANLALSSLYKEVLAPVTKGQESGTTILLGLKDYKIDEIFLSL